MSSQPSLDAEAPSDAELITSVREGDLDAYGELFARHRAAAVRLARQLTSSGNADDLVSDAFNSVLKVLTAGGGPDIAFRAYLLTAIRRRHIDVLRSQKRVETTGDLDTLDSGEPFRDPAVQAFESSAAAHAFRSLPERWQTVLWQLEVEAQKPAEVAVLMGISPNSVSALAYRAREGLKQAYLQNHLADTADEECRWTTERLGPYVRNGLSKRDSTKVSEHLDGCDRCSALYLELVEVNSNLRGVIAPIVLGAAAASYLASVSTPGAVTGISVAAWLGRVRHVVTTHSKASAGVAAAVAAVLAASAFALARDGGQPAQASAEPTRTDPGASASSNPTAGPVPPGASNPAPGPTVSVPSSGPFFPVAVGPSAPGASVPGLAPAAAARTTAPSVASPTPGSPATGPASSPPTSTTPTTTPPPVPRVDVVLVESHHFEYVKKDRRYVLHSKVTVTASKPGADLVVHLSSTTGQLHAKGQGQTWACTTPQPAAELTCTATAKTPGTLWVWMFQPRKSPNFQYAMNASAPGTDDPDPSNNAWSFSGSAKP